MWKGDLCYIIMYLKYIYFFSTEGVFGYVSMKKKLWKTEIVGGV